MLPEPERCLPADDGANNPSVPINKRRKKKKKVPRGKRVTHVSAGNVRAPLTCICCVFGKYPLTKSQLSVVRKLGPPRSSMVFCLLSPVISVVVEDA